MVAGFLLFFFVLVEEIKTWREMKVSEVGKWFLLFAGELPVRPTRRRRGKHRFADRRTHTHIYLKRRETVRWRVFGNIKIVGGNHRLGLNK